MGVNTIVNTMYVHWEKWHTLNISTQLLPEVSQLKGKTKLMDTEST